MAEAIAGGATAIHDLLDVILKSILASMIDTRARNAATLVDWKRLVPERGARTSLTLRGDAVHSNPNHSVHQTATTGDEVRHPSPPLPSFQDRAAVAAARRWFQV
ncbi:F-box protein MAX2-like [Vitis riparia]|uniref:F-box protein MAX2-like n=1 Tax=Vitis riparia TaxID=96939 RepID=UPI00155AA1CD|nr:F-box protein MAX2-like [Vitis riparia]